MSLQEDKSLKIVKPISTRQGRLSQIKAEKMDTMLQQTLHGDPKFKRSLLKFNITPASRQSSHESLNASNQSLISFSGNRKQIVNKHHVLSKPFFNEGIPKINESPRFTTNGVQYDQTMRVQKKSRMITHMKSQESLHHPPLFFINQS